MQMTKRILTHSVALAGLSAFAMARPFDPNGAPQAPTWKMGEGGIPELREGNPVYIAADGTEAVFDIRTLPQLNAEARTYRERARTAAEQLKQFEGIDPEAARNAMQRVADIGDKDLIDKGEVEKVRSRVNEEWQKKYQPLETENAELKGQIQKLVADNAFAQSKFVQERLSIPVDMVQAAFGKNFKYEDGVLVAYDNNGERLYSAKNQNGVPDFEEAIELLISKYPNRDRILKADEHSGGGGSGGGNKGRGRVMRRSEFEAQPPQVQAQLAAEQRAGTLQLVD